MPDAPTANTQDLANTEYDAQRRARAAAGDQPGPLSDAPSGPTAPPPASSDDSPQAASPATET